MSAKLAYLGPEGTFCQLAAEQYLKAHGVNFTLEEYPSIAKLLKAIAENHVTMGIVPAENSIEGSVNVTMDMLAGNLSLYIHGELILNITHHLFSYATDYKKIDLLLSHPQALAQCQSFIEKNLSKAKIIETNSTAQAIQHVAQANENSAAIGSLNSQQHYKVPVLANDIADYHHNQTRFLLIGNQPIFSENTSKTSLVLRLKKDRPGGLYEILGEFAQQKINLTRIESRPSKEELGNYLFFIDCEAGHNHPGLHEILKRLTEKTSSLKHLGSYNNLTMNEVPN